MSLRRRYFTWICMQNWNTFALILRKSLQTVIIFLNLFARKKQISVSSVSFY